VRTRPLLIDAYCCGGAASMGYHRAGFDVIGVDIAPQPDYPFEFHQGDAIEFIKEHGHRADVIAGSPPCQHKSRLRHYNDTAERRAAYHGKYPNLIPQTREAMVATGKPYVIENVPQADLINPIVLCGHMFGLTLYRHRAFESNMRLTAPPEPKPYHPYRCTRNGYLPTPDRPYMSIHGGKHSRAWQRKAAEVMGAPWLTTIVAVCEAIPPAYTEHIGRQLMEALR
jgi:DNA (cytosine-5)-methyltransferase 1